MTTLRIKKTCALLLTVLVSCVCLAFAGCASSSGQTSFSSASSPASSSLSVQAEQELVFGEKTDTAVSIAFKNETGADITKLAAVPVAGSTAAVQLMKADDKWPAGKVATVYVEPASDGVYNLSLANGDKALELHDINFTRFNEMNIMKQEDVAYVTAVLDGNPVSTLSEEYDRAHPPAPASDSAPAPAAEETQEYVENNVVYYDEPAGGGGAPAQTEDSCVSDIVLN